MGISRDSRHKRRETGGKRKQFRKKRKFELGRQPANTKLGGKRVHTVRVRGGHLKFRALHLETGNFSWGTEVCARKTRILDVVYNASNNELVRTKTLVKGAVVLVDATPFRQWYEAHYGVKIGVKKNAEKVEEDAVKKSDHVLRKLANRQRTRVLDPKIDITGAAMDAAAEVHHHHMHGMAPPPDSSTASPEMMHMSFFWGTNAEILFHRWPGERSGMYALALVFVFVLAFIVEWLTHCRLIKEDSSAAAAGLIRTLMHTVRVGLAYLVMLAVMSFNVGVLLVAIGGHCFGFFLFGSRFFKRSEAASGKSSDLPPLSC